jgi:hypothetical protein
MSANDKTKFQDAMLEISRQQDVIDGAVKLYGVATNADTTKYHAMAHAALDALLDATRAKHFLLEKMIREGGAQ